MNLQSVKTAVQGMSPKQKVLAALAAAGLCWGGYHKGGELLGPPKAPAMETVRTVSRLSELAEKAPDQEFQFAFKVATGYLRYNGEVLLNDSKDFKSPDTLTAVADVTQAGFSHLDGKRAAPVPAAAGKTLKGVGVATKYNGKPQIKVIRGEIK